MSTKTLMRSAIFATVALLMAGSLAAGCGSGT